MTRAFSPESLVVGLALVAIGIVWTLGNLGRLDALSVLRTWWPTTLVVWGLLELADLLTRRREGRS